MFLRALLVIFAFCIHSAHAHKSSDSYLTLDADPTRVTGRWDIALRDLDLAVGLDTDANGVITWGEVKAKQADIIALAQQNLQITRGAMACALAVDTLQIAEHTDGRYAVLPLTSPCATEPSGSIALRYTLLRDIDAQHRGLLKLTEGGVQSTQVLDPAVTSSNPAQHSFSSFVLEGIHHISIGLDHVLFIVLMLIALVQTNPFSAPRQLALDVLKVITAFTLAHSCTLALAALGVVNLPTRWVEAAIAATLVLTALDVIRPFLRSPRWVSAFLFGLIHGLGLASALTGLSLGVEQRVAALLGFNIGVELGQLAIASIALGGLFILSRLPTITLPRFVRYAAAPVGILAFGWMLERALDTKWLPI
jgi:hypothetical protein